MFYRWQQRFSFFVLFLEFVFLLWLTPATAGAIHSPLDVSNNRYGIHVADTGRLEDVAKLVNSSGGDWGYVTVVIQDTDRNRLKWQSEFDRMRRLHLIPLVRLATHVENRYWTIPQESDINEWVKFLDSLNWPIQNRYVILFNEPNHAKEWGGTINPSEYARIFSVFATNLKQASEDFFILPAGLDFSASSNGDSLDATDFLNEVVLTSPEFCTLIDGWTSHSYPNPGFVSSPTRQGRGSLAGFRWELDFLHNLGCENDLPVFITETGWVHNQAGDKIGLRPDVIGRYVQIAADSIWQDSQIAAITPFIFQYLDYPFSQFGWQKPDNTLYEHGKAYLEVMKKKGHPVQIERFASRKLTLPAITATGSLTKFSFEIFNTGQSIIGEDEEYRLVVRSNGFPADYFSESFRAIEPGQQGEVKVWLTFPQKPGRYLFEVGFQRSNQPLRLIEKRSIEIVSIPHHVQPTLLFQQLPGRVSFLPIQLCGFT